MNAAAIRGPKLGSWADPPFGIPRRKLKDGSVPPWLLGWPRTSDCAGRDRVAAGDGPATTKTVLAIQRAGR